MHGFVLFPKFSVESFKIYKGNKRKMVEKPLIEHVKNSKYSLIIYQFWKNLNPFLRIS